MSKRSNVCVSRAPERVCGLGLLHAGLTGDVVQQGTTGDSEEAEEKVWQGGERRQGKSSLSSQQQDTEEGQTITEKHNTDVEEKTDGRDTPGCGMGIKRIVVCLHVFQSV